MTNHEDKTTATPSSGWPGGWYVFENGKVDGPFSAEDTFKLTSETSDGKPRLISRKGFSQWYALKDLSEIFKMTDQLGRQVRAQSEITEAQLIAAQMGLETARIVGKPPTSPLKVTNAKAVETPVQAASRSTAESKSAPEAVVPRFSEKPAEKTPIKVKEAAAIPALLAKAGLSKKKISTDSPAKVARPVVGGAAAQFSDPPVVAQEPPVRATALDRGYMTETSGGAPAPSESPELVVKGSKATLVAPKVSGKAQEKKALMQEYFMAKGRLRLGKMRNPWITSFVGLPLTLGVLWVFWMRDLARETVYHARNVEKAPMPPIGLALIPFVHMYMTYRVAKLIVEMEAQNKYRSVTPWVAVLFSVFPPFAMAYLQDAVNRHWLLHVKHALAKKRAAGE